jgi:hypothetical protein
MKKVKNEKPRERWEFLLTRVHVTVLYLKFKHVKKVKNKCDGVK